MEEIIFDFEKADASSRRVLENAPDEDAVQNWLAEHFRLRRRERLHTQREVEVVLKNMPDIVLASTEAKCEVAVEVKHGDMKWTVRKLEHALTHQLVENYLKPNSRRHGILVVTNHRNRHWQHPMTRKRMTFAEVIAHLSVIAEQIASNSSGPVTVVVRGIDASPITKSSKGDGR